MRLPEYKAKEIFKEYNIKVPNSFIYNNQEIPKNCLAKAQVLYGKRGKQGLILEANKENIEKLKQYKILIEEKIKVKRELYLAITIDRIQKDFVVLFSEQGGMDIEEMPIKKYKIEEINKLPSNIQPIAQNLLRIIKEKKAILAEINPLAETDNQLIALDAKIILQGKEQPTTELERLAQENNLNYVELEGDIGIIGNGAGLVMATLDLIGYFNGKPANFLDIGGGATKEKMETALNLITKKQLKSIFINIFGGITRCDEIAQGLVNYKNNNQTPPLIVRMIGTDEKQAKEILEKNNIKFVDSMEQGAKLACQY